MRDEYIDAYRVEKFDSTCRSISVIFFISRHISQKYHLANELPSFVGFANRSEILTLMIYVAMQSASIAPGHLHGASEQIPHKSLTIAASVHHI